MPGLREWRSGVRLQNVDLPVLNEVIRFHFLDLNCPSILELELDFLDDEKMVCESLLRNMVRIPRVMR
jgi:hypothetical protein